MNLSPMCVLSPEDIAAIHEATVDILASCGVRVQSSRMLQLLADRGLEVDTQSGIVRFPRGSVEDAIASTPRSFEVFGRDGEPAFVLGDGTPRVAAGHNAIFWVDSETGQTRPSTVRDVEQFAHLCELLDNIDMIGIPVMPQDVPLPAATLLYGVRACIQHSRKPIYYSTDRPEVNRAIIRMLQRAFRGDLARQVYAITQVSPTSPLWWEEGVLEQIIETVETGVPIAILPEPNAGVSAPFTLAGLLTVNNAECLSGMAMIQLLKPGAKALYANSWTTTDMRSGAALVGSCETTVCRIAGAQLARFYNLPCHTTAPNSDNHAHDEQNAWEKTLSQFCAIAVGNDLIVNCGMFATGMTCSHEQLLMDDEISAMARRIAAGVRVNADTIGADLIKSVGPAGTGYITSDHTMRWLRSDEYLTPRLAVRGSRAIWESAGAKDTYQIARDEVARLLQEPAAPMDSARLEAVSQVVDEFVRGA